MQPGGTTRSSHANLGAEFATASLRFPPEDSGHSLAEMAQRDLDAALQLLADRAQYITGAGGAAIALRRNGRNDMLCRASTGANAPELGALLSTEFGLSGESVRTRQPLRCDDAGRDARVNREVCRQMGIASVAVMPVVHDDEVLGVFELFSGQAHAFGERDLTALRRLSEMVETAVRLARAAESLPELRTMEPAPEVVATEVLDLPEGLVEPLLESISEPPPDSAVETKPEATLEFPAEAAALPMAPAQAIPLIESPPVAAQPDPPAPVSPAVPKRPLFWSVAAVETTNEAERPAEPDQSHVPPMLRNLRKCEACGFPVSAGRVLCVECEEKRWRGQLRVPQPAFKPSPRQTPAASPAVRAFAAAAQSSAVAAPVPQPHPPSGVAAETSKPIPAGRTTEQPTKAGDLPVSRPSFAAPVLSAAVVEAPAGSAETPALPEITFSAGLEPSQSWFSRNKYILGALLVVAATVTAIVLMR